MRRQKVLIARKRPAGNGHDGRQLVLLQIAHDGAPADSEQRYAAEVLASALGDDSGSRLYWALVDPGLADSADMSFHEYEGTGAFYTYISGEAERVLWEWPFPQDAGETGDPVSSGSSAIVDIRENGEVAEVVVRQPVRDDLSASRGEHESALGSANGLVIRAHDTEMD